MYWSVGKCKKGETCEYQHPPKKPILEDILDHKSSIKATPDENEGIKFTTPEGLPSLPPNGKCRVMEGGDLVIYFIPFFKPIDNITYYKKIRLFRYNKNKKEYKLVFSYTRKDFHITTATASNGYLVCSRLPYDQSVLKMMAEAKRLRNKNEKLEKKLKQNDEKFCKQIAELKNKNRYLSDEVTRSNSELRMEREQSKARDVANNNNVARLESIIRDNIRARDPVDIFVFDPTIKCHVHVLEYHKPADHVDLKGRTLALYDKKSGLTHTFEITMQTKNAKGFNLDEPLQPKQLCPDF